eukprot:90945-Lingulodinium_polyedra.AAC.1
MPASCMCVSVFPPPLDVRVQISRELAVRLLLPYWPAWCQRGACTGSGAQKLRPGRAHPCQ